MNVLLVYMLMISSPSILYDFQLNSNVNDWRIVDDGVMGGVSKGTFSIDEQGNGLFSGMVSTANNGGFSSVRCNFNRIPTISFSKFRIRVKGDGGAYQFRVKSDLRDYHSYIWQFKTNGNWQEIEIPFDEMYPAFRGRRLNIPNYTPSTMSQIAILIGNKKNEDFSLLIDRIEIL